MTDQNDSSQYGMLHFPLSRLVLIEHRIELFVLALMQPREFRQVWLCLLCFYHYGAAR